MASNKVTLIVQSGYGIGTGMPGKVIDYTARAAYTELNREQRRLVDRNRDKFTVK